MTIEIGGTALRLHTESPGFQALLRKRYGNFETASARDPIELRIDLTEAPQGDRDIAVSLNAGVWTIERGDFRATYDPALRSGIVKQTVNPWSIDALIRIIHSLELGHDGGFLVHAASAIRNRRAFVFAGLSGAGKTTLSRLAPPDAALLTDEISYIRRAPDGVFHAWGTPFAGELGTPGENIHAPAAALYFPEHAAENRLVAIPGAEALRRLMRNILFFAEDPELVQLVFETAALFLQTVPAYRLLFLPDARVWSLIE